MFSPDGGRVAFQIASAGQTDIAGLDLASGAVTRLTQTSLHESLPIFSDDGKRVLFVVGDRDPILSRIRTLSRVASVAWAP